MKAIPGIIYSIESKQLDEKLFAWFNRVFTPIHENKNYLLIETNKRIQPIQGINEIDGINIFLDYLQRTGFNILMINY
jgi:DNA helicase TIP49 (TBP-interacting protein)